MLWFARIAEKFDLPLYKSASPETMRQLKELKEKVRRERKQLNFRIVRTPKIQELIDAPVEQTPDMPINTQVAPTPNQMPKVAGVSFSIADSHKIAQPKTIFDLSYTMLHWAHKNIPHNIFEASVFNITPDGGDWDKFLGTMNWYVDDVERTVPYIKMAIATELEPLGIQARIREVNQSKLNGKQAVRMEITNNNTQGLEELPELGMPQSTYLSMSRMLNLPTDYYAGEMKAQDMLTRISAARGQVGQHTRPAEDSGGPGTGKARWIDPGLDSNALNAYLDELEHLAQYALKMNNATIVWG